MSDATARFEPDVASSAQDADFAGNPVRARPAGTRSTWRTTRASPRTRTLLLAWATAALALLAFLYGRGVYALEVRCLAMPSQLQRMRQDAARILDLRQTPKTALGKRRSSEELLAAVEQALAAADIPRERWKDSIPQPLARVAGTDYQKQTTQLYFDDLAMKQIAAFAVTLPQKDPTLHLLGLGLTQRTAGYDVELDVEYFVYLPQHAKDR